MISPIDGRNPNFSIRPERSEIFNLFWVPIWVGFARWDNFWLKPSQGKQSWVQNVNSGPEKHDLPWTKVYSIMFIVLSLADKNILTLLLVTPNFYMDFTIVIFKCNRLGIAGVSWIHHSARSKSFFLINEDLHTTPAYTLVHPCLYIIFINDKWYFINFTHIYVYMYVGILIYKAYL